LRNTFSGVTDAGAHHGRRPQLSARSTDF